MAGCVGVTCIVVGEMTVFVQHKDNLDKINSKPHTNTNPRPEIEKTFLLQHNLTTIYVVWEKRKNECTMKIVPKSSNGIQILIHD